MTKDSHDRWGMLPREDKLPLYLMSEMPAGIRRAEYDIIIAVNPTHNADILQNLKAHDWPNIMFSENWEKDNATTREVFYRTYLKEKGVRFLKDDAGLTYLEYDGPHGLFKIYYDIDEIYKSALLGDINNIILPSIFDDYSLLGAYGPYEYGPVRLKGGDTTLDLGANIGMFSCVAASKGCSVHAFEPTPKTYTNYLLKNASLYKNFFATNVAALDFNGKIPLYINDNYNESNNITRNSIHKDLETSFRKILVDTITIDSYVDNCRIDNVRFIKSHTEYAEDILREGAVNTLRSYAPSLAFYFQKALSIDRWKAIESKIRALQSDYKFEYSWRRMFAWV